MTDLPPGPELDRLIAERVMGWAVVDVPGSGRWRTNSDKSVSCPEELVPHYSTSIERAWEVVEKLDLIGIKTFGERSALRALSHNHDHWLIHDDLGYGPDVVGVSAPHAICLAALKAVS